MLQKHPHLLLLGEAFYVPLSPTLLLNSVNLNLKLMHQPHQALPSGCRQNWILDSDFKCIVIDVIAEGDEEGLTKEQEILDTHDNEVASHISH